MSKYTYGIIIASDKGYEGSRKDLCVDTIKNIVDNEKFELISHIVLPDERELLSTEMLRLSKELKVDLVLTSGGTGFSKRDVTVEATKDVIERETPGISEAMRIYSLGITKKAMLSRATSGICENTLIVNLPGSPKAVSEILEYIIEPLEHGIDILKGDAKECAR
ncbi:MAG: molybdenum cofactor biosynthesis protein B [Lachnospirales bacterium]